MQNSMKSKWKDWKNQQNIFTWLSQMELKAKYIHFILCLMKMRAFLHCLWRYKRCMDGWKNASKIASRIGKEKPALIIHAGDIVKKWSKRRAVD